LIYKEILNNIVKHSKAKNCRIKIESKINVLNLEITDDGIGFDREKLNRINGLTNIEGRAKKINAEIQIASVVREGTKISLVVNK
jgi:signal transduction histidine kinase